MRMRWRGGSADHIEPRIRTGRPRPTASISPRSPNPDQRVVADCFESSPRSGMRRDLTEQLGLIP